MTLEDGLNSPAMSNSLQQSHHHYHHLMDWLEDSISYLPDFLTDTSSYSLPQHIPSSDSLFHHQNQSFSPSSSAPPPITLSQPTPKPEFPPKRKLYTNPPAAQRRRTTEEFEEQSKAQGRKTAVINSGGKEARWAEQLLNPLSAAIEASNISRAQHLIYVLKELASASGDANQRLAFHGLRHLAGAGVGSPLDYASTESRLFCSSLIKFNELNPWFSFSNCLANEAILQAAAMGGAGRSLHVVDIGVSHGLQWPTLMEALARRAGAGTGLVRLTVVGSGTGGPFGSGPAGYDFVPQLLRYAKSIELGVRVERKELGEIVRRGSGKEVTVICAQFRAGRAGREAAGFWRGVKEMEPDLLVLSEMEGCGGAGFGEKAEVLWSFLESTGVGFRGRDCEERRVVEGEAARLLEEDGGEGWGRERWREKMEVEGFEEEGFGEEALDAGRGLLRKYDGNWEMRADDGAVGLRWRGKPVSFCSLWKLRGNTREAGFVTSCGGGGRRR